ncbi:MAG: 1,3-beta-galactosyl-N-acetylhexosamine phosphorylase [Clostridia bacterium]|nr:1,3-beta-galactosyl-N-acetylhexosamine phosphorylase [Clostridia bacterium]
MLNTATTGSFTLPGEAGYEQLTLELARRWGADVIRDSDGTRLSEEITRAGYRIYSTICVIREHNAFAEAHPDAQQQCFLSSEPVMAEGETAALPLMAGYFDEQFAVNDSPEALCWWQVWDRTAQREVPREQWAYADGQVTVRGALPFHRYTCSFLAWRVWEEINMYNHTTNHWTSEHLRQLDPRHPAAWDYLLRYMDDWCAANPRTDVIRLTSLFYNFVWIFGDDLRRRSRFTDWASYDFTVSPAALTAFEKEYGYHLTAEDFIQKGLLQPTHRVPTPAKRDWMAFIQRFVAEKARALVDIIHRHGKQAYVFYDDSWVGMEPWGEHFASIGFDGLIKCVFSGFEVRLCAGAEVPVHELRLHPYLFPVGLGGLPTFSEGGHPEADALRDWRRVRRALLRQCVDRIGLGGYLHLTRGFDAYVDTVERIAGEFRQLKALHAAGAPETLPIRVAVLHTWGRLRSWTLSGHFHETYMHTLIHINEALAGLPVEVKYLSFEEAEDGALDGFDAVISAGEKGDAWSGGDAWRSEKLVTALTRFAHEGGCVIGVGAPSAVDGYDTLLRLAPILGVDIDEGQYACHAPWLFDEEPDPRLTPAARALPAHPGVRLTDGRAKVLCAENGLPKLTLHPFGKGLGIYLSGFAVSPESARLLLELLLTARPEAGRAWLTDTPLAEAAYYPAAHALAVASLSDSPLTVTVNEPEAPLTLNLAPLELKLVEK